MFRVVEAGKLGRAIQAIQTTTFISRFRRQARSEPSEPREGGGSGRQKLGIPKVQSSPPFPPIDRWICDLVFLGYRLTRSLSVLNGNDSDSAREAERVLQSALRISKSNLRQIRRSMCTYHKTPCATQLLVQISD